MTLNHNRIDEIFFLLGIVFPIPENPKKKAKFDALVGGKIEKVIPEFLNLFKQLLKNNLDDAEMWLNFMAQSVSYIKMESDELPQVDYPQEEINRLMSYYNRK